MGEREAAIKQKQTKDDIIRTLREENPPIGGDEKYTQFFLIIELKKITSDIGIFKGELYTNDLLEYRGSFLTPLLNLNPQQQMTWNPIEIGNSVFYGFSFDLREKGLIEQFRAFFHRSLGEGKLQEFLPFVGIK
jgi:hypothetical protein